MRPRESSDEELLDRVGGALARRTSLGRWSLAEVAAEVGVAPATLVKRFGSRKGLLLALSRRWVDSVPTEPVEPAAPRDELVSWVERSFALAGSHDAAVAGVQLLLEDLADPDLSALLREGWDRQVGQLARLLAASDLPRLRDPQAAATLLFDSLNGARLRAAAGDTTAVSPAQNLERLLEAWT